MFWTEITGKDGRSLGRIAVRNDMDEEIVDPSPCTINSRSRVGVSSGQLRHHRELPLAIADPRRESRRSPRTAPRTMQWSKRQSRAIQQWRDMTTPSPHPREQQRPEQHDREQHSREHHSQEQRSSEQPRRRHRDNQPRSTDSLRSDASLGSSTSSHFGSSSKKPRDVASNLKYLVRGFSRQFRSTPSAKDDRRKKFTDKESFVPSPKVTFLIDEPNLVCQICQQTPLKMAVTAETPGPEVPTLLPCAHIFCKSCIDFWLASHNSCPFCRADMIHKGCGHQVEPRLIAYDTIHTLPETLPNGGKIGENCFKCAEKDRRHISLARWTKLAEAFKAPRYEAEILGTDEAIEIMHKAQKAFERLPEDDYWVLSRMRHHQW
ncbi:hypothetical protein HD806DRAFT_514938 [Xylariaceae sp. AK1471]|nr:hypothetical protein HD806DRAFT_514938 [Xylariaceae sp. AK1471]